MITLLFLSIGAVLTLLVWHQPRAMTIGILLLTLAGEFSRVDLPVGPRGILLTDLLIPLLVGVWLLRLWATHTPLPKHPIILPLLCFGLWNSFLLFFTPLTLSAGEWLDGALYFLRYGSYMALIPIIAHSFEGRTLWGRHWLMITGVALSLIGFVQLAIYPDFKTMAEIGWDPHINRLLATWFDPNFVGGLLGLTAAMGLGVVFSSESPKTKAIYGTMALIMLYALFLTYSRSGYLMFVATAGVLLLLRNVKLTMILGIAALMALPLSPRAMERVVDMYHSGLALVSDSYEYSLDPTARFRVQSWQETLSIFQNHPIIAVGYNNLKAARIQEGFEKDPTSHAATGADSSLLLILATTGLPGALLFLWIYWTIITQAWHRYRTHTGIQTLNTTVIAGTTGLFIHSMFVNSLFFPFLLIPYVFLVGLALPLHHQQK